MKVTLYDKSGEKLGDREVTIPRYAMTQINGVVRALGGGVTEEAASLEIEPIAGGGSVLGVVTVIDNRNDDAVTHTATEPPRSRDRRPPMETDGQGTLNGQGKPKWNRRDRRWTGIA